jgi:hypothetical protein
MYIDPNTGGMLFQVLAVAFTAIVGVLLIFKGRITAGIGRLRRMLNRKGEQSTEEKRSE